MSETKHEEIISIAETQKSPQFKLVSFTPVGYKVINYPTKYCVLCKGELVNPCSVCPSDSSDCGITNKDEAYYHIHCQQNIKTK
ncbi:hypothetical protein QLL95_gp0715 [Cotonvirus japonicus]|uniref:PHD-type domain-containing protein n=1 Tax=Cotonvirus japonicus TaxID=2811091 RepID=A0ABM7NTA6_9VIRU|nr:hypothetical protein QLL95_gp0715 [Cotonvirus japonicus]BCS83408.1 hypothetical protein [Cotonvirus japonicus]